MSNEPGPCLAATEILAYLNGELPEARQPVVEGHLDECRLCGAAVEGVAVLESREGFLRSTESIRARIRARTATADMAVSAVRRSAARFRPAPRYLALAATLAVSVGGAVLLTRPGPDETLFRQHFAPYPRTDPVVRGASDDRIPDDGRSSALTLYEARDYKGALAAFEGSLRREPRDPVVLFYAGLCRLALGQASAAIQDLEQVRRLDEHELQLPAEWYLALAHLRRHDLPAARSSLDRIAERGGFYRENARALLSELNRLERAK